MTLQQVPPLVTVRAAKSPTGYGTSPFANQELLLGARVYTVPDISVRTHRGGRVAPAADGSYRLGPDPAELTATCPAGSQVQLWAPWFRGSAALGGSADGHAGGSARPLRLRSDLRGRRSAAMGPLGTVPGTGRVAVRFTPVDGGPWQVPAHPVGCLDPVRLRAAVDRLTATGARHVEVSGTRISARLPHGSRGFAVLSAPALRGWQCAAGDGPKRPADSYLGLLAVPLDGSADSVSCSFTPPGLGAGTAVGGAGLLLLAGLVVVRRLRPRTTGKTGGRRWFVPARGAEESAETASTAETEAPTAAGAAAVAGTAEPRKSTVEVRKR